MVSDVFLPVPEEMIPFDQYFSGGLRPTGEVCLTLPSAISIHFLKEQLKSNHSL